MKTNTMNKEFCKEIISNKVYEIRTKFNLTQDDLGEMLNVDQSIISSIETGRRHIQIHEL